MVEKKWLKNNWIIHKVIPGWHWHWITYKGWYAIKQKTWKKSNQSFPILSLFSSSTFVPPLFSFCSSSSLSLFLLILFLLLFDFFLFLLFSFSSYSFVSFLLFSFFFPHSFSSPFGYGCTICRLHLCRKVRSPLWVSCIRHWTIWWRGSSPGALRNVYPFIAITVWSTPTWSDSTC